MIHCASCGHENPEGASICAQCGRPLVPLVVPLAFSGNAGSGEPLLPPQPVGPGASQPPAEQPGEPAAGLSPEATPPAAPPPQPPFQPPAPFAPPFPAPGAPPPPFGPHPGPMLMSPPPLPFPQPQLTGGQKTGRYFIGIGLGFVPVVVALAIVLLGNGIGGSVGNALLGAALYLPLLVFVVMLSLMIYFLTQARFRFIGYGLLTVVVALPVIAVAGCILILYQLS